MAWKARPVENPVEIEMDEFGPDVKQKYKLREMDEPLEDGPPNFEGIKPKLIETKTPSAVETIDKVQIMREDMKTIDPCKSHGYWFDTKTDYGPKDIRNLDEKNYSCVKRLNVTINLSDEDEVLEFMPDLRKFPNLEVVNLQGNVVPKLINVPPHYFHDIKDKNDNLIIILHGQWSHGVNETYTKSLNTLAGGLLFKLFINNRMKFGGYRSVKKMPTKRYSKTRILKKLKSKHRRNRTHKR